MTNWLLFLYSIIFLVSYLFWYYFAHQTPDSSPKSNCSEFLPVSQRTRTMSCSLQKIFPACKYFDSELDRFSAEINDPSHRIPS